MDQAHPARVVLAEVSSPGSVHYLLEAEGFQVVGCAADDGDLARLLAQDLDPDVVVIDADISATAVLVAKEHAPDARVIVIWPEDVQPLAGTERVAPRLVYEQLGPVIRRAVRERPPIAETLAAVRAQVDALLDEPVDQPVVEPEESAPVRPRAASRVSATSMLLVAAILLTMGVSFAFEGRHDRATTGTLRPVASVSGVRPTGSVSALAGGRGQTGTQASPTPSCRPAVGTPNNHASAKARGAHARVCPTKGSGAAHKPTHPTKDDHPGNKGSGSNHGQGGGSHANGGGANHDTSTEHGQSHVHPSGPPDSPSSNGHDTGGQAADPAGPA